MLRLRGFPMIVSLVAVAAIPLAVNACGSSAPEKKASLGAGGDDPSSSSNGPSNGTMSGTSSGTTSGGCQSSSPPPPSPEPPAAMCLPDVPCAADSDCANGNRCNHALEPPACEKLYCGDPGTPCSDDVFCTQGLKCFKSICYSCNTCGNLCEVDFNTDPNHCGCCDHAVPAGGICVDGVAQCAAGQTDCSGTCADLENDPQNCGMCGNALPQDILCSGGTPVCADQEGFCNGACVFLNDEGNCGACGAVCIGGTFCQDDGTCGANDQARKTCTQVCQAAGMQCTSDPNGDLAEYDCGQCNLLDLAVGCNSTPAATTVFNNCSCSFNQVYCACAPKK